jgi:hypothetical protein
LFPSILSLTILLTVSWSISFIIFLVSRWIVKHFWWNCVTKRLSALYCFYAFWILQPCFHLKAVFPALFRGATASQILFEKQIRDYLKFPPVSWNKICHKETMNFPLDQILHQYCQTSIHLLFFSSLSSVVLHKEWKGFETGGVPTQIFQSRMKRRGISRVLPWLYSYQLLLRSKNSLEIFRALSLFSH